MKTFFFVIALLLVEMVHADTVSTTYVCKGAKGEKSVQDHPCDGDVAPEKTLPTLHHVEDMSEYLRLSQAENQRNTTTIQCTGQRKILAQTQQSAPRIVANRLDQIHAGWARDSELESQAYIDQNCTPVGH